MIRRTRKLSAKIQLSVVISAYNDYLAAQNQVGASFKQSGGAMGFMPDYGFFVEHLFRVRKPGIQPFEWVTRIVVQALSALALIVCASSTIADDAEALAKKAQNPIACLISLPLQNNTNFGVGADDKTQKILNIQPVWPISIGENCNLITRTIMPVISQPGLATGYSAHWLVISGRSVVEMTLM